MKVKSSNKNYHPPVEKDGPLSRDDVLCPVCWSILIEPVTFPCAHSICLQCFRSTVKETSFSCPCCRVRISNWSRRAEKNGTLVNGKLWERIQTEFPKFVSARQLGQDTQDVLAEINAEEAVNSADFDDENKNSFRAAKKSPPISSCEKSDVPVNLHELRKKAARLKEEIEEADAQLIRKLKAEDGFATQQLIFDDELDSVPSVESSVIVPCRTSVNVEPVLQSSQNKSHGSQGKVLCKNLFSEWEIHSEPASDPQEPTSLKRVTSTVTKSSHKSLRKLINSKDSSKKTEKFSSPRSLRVVEDLNTKESSLKTISPYKDMASSFVPVYSPRLMTADLPHSVTNGACRLDEAAVADVKLKQVDQVKRSHSQTPDTPDSINIEVNCHFRPIRSAPRTPPKQLPDGSFYPEPKLVKSTPTRLAPVPGLLATLFQRSGQSTSTRHSSTSTFSEDSGGSTPSFGTGHAFSPPPPALVHYAFQGLSPNSYASDTQEDTMGGRLTGPPPELEACGSAPSDGHDKDRRISEMMYREVQAYQLEQFRKRKLQEDSDREYAEKLQMELNKQGSAVARTRGSTERRPTLDSPPQSSSSSKSNPSAAIPGKKYSPRTRRSTRVAAKKSPAKATTPVRKGKPTRKSTSRAKDPPKRSTDEQRKPQTRNAGRRK